MKVYDSLSNKRYELILKNISIYNCGPTVYNDIHIGNARPLVTFDVLVRFLKALRFNVLYVHNITDIDDKIINQAKILKETEMQVATTFFNHYLDVNKALNILPIEKMPKVSENIPGIMEYIQKLINVKAAYVTDDGDVYFDVKSIPIYGMLSHQNIEQLQAGIRKELAADKKSPLDFVL
jgi:cysteinyl-tRNA synthetase